jgi:signal transduction histidine kinase
MQYEEHEFQILQGRSAAVTGRLVPHGKTPWEHRYSAVVMPLVLAGNRFGFMWAETGPKDWDVYVRVKNLLSSALLRTMLVQQRERAQKEVERLLQEARDRAVELARARDAAENAAAQNAQLFKSEQARRRGAEALARSSRSLSSLSTLEKLPSQILEQLQHVLLCERAFLIMEDANGVPIMRSQRGFAKEVPIADLQLRINHTDFYQTVVRGGEPLIVRDVNEAEGWEQSTWMPHDRSWLGVPLFSKDNVIGLLALAREKESFTEDDALLATTFAMQAMVAMENARLYDELTGINQMMEDLVAQRVEELKNAYKILDQHDRNKSAFIQVAAHELRTPLTVIKGYLGMLKANEAIRTNPELDQTIDGVARGTDRLHQIVTSMLDVARLDNQAVTPNIEPVSLGLMLRLVHKDYAQDLELRNLTFTLEESVKNLPPVLGDTELLKKALDHVVVNAIKYTPDGGTITVAGQAVQDSRLGDCAEIRVKDTGIGIDREYHEIIFEKLFQLGKVELHSSSRTNYKGGGAGLGLAIASGIIKSLKGAIWVESAGHDEVNFPGSTFIIRLPLAK